MSLPELLQDFLLKFLKLASLRVLLANFDDLRTDLILLDLLDLLPPIRHDLDLPFFRPLLICSDLPNLGLSFFHLTGFLFQLAFHQFGSLFFGSNELLVFELSDHRCLLVQEDRPLSHYGRFLSRVYLSHSWLGVVGFLDGNVIHTDFAI